ncbi:MAG: hypothetical protein Q8L69_07855 [Gallionellaceae bacterium]|nr:hypothetical protein [Gallionellaceae bacterium]
MNEISEWIEKAALENLRGHSQIADGLAKESATTLTILLAALSGAFGYALTVPEYRIGSVAMTAYLFALCVALVTRCMMIKEFPATTNEPRNLNQQGFALDDLRNAELKNFQARIDQAAQRNATTAQWLNRVRLGAIGSPLIFAIAISAVELVHLYGKAAAAG